MTKIRKTISILLTLCALLTCLLPLCLPSSAAAAQSWYVKREKDHRQPRLDTAQNMIGQYGGFYIDKAHGDDCEEKVIYLTFDAGYENGNVASILDTLQKEKVTAAFFILGHLIDAEPALVRRMQKEGHFVCNHTSSHKDVTRMTKEAFTAELRSLEEAYARLTGEKMKKYFRPPEGKYSEESLAWAQEMGYKTVFWSFAYADWDNGSQPELRRARKKIEDNLHNGAVMLFHPTSKTNALLLPELIRAWKAEGYRFGTLDELTK